MTTRSGGMGGGRRLKEAVKLRAWVVFFGLKNVEGKASSAEEGWPCEQWRPSSSNVCKPCQSLSLLFCFVLLMTAMVTQCNRGII